MNKVEVIMAIKRVRTDFGRVMAALSGEEFATGYRHACSDLVRLFNDAPMYPDFDAERDALLAEIKRLRAENEMLNQNYAKQRETIEELLAHVDLHDVLGIEKPKMQRKITFWVK